MPNIEPTQTALSAGELSPRLYGHIDFGKYGQAVEILQNMYCWTQGPIHRRSGFKHAHEVKDSTQQAPRLLTLELNTNTAFVIEMGNLYFRFYTNKAIIEVVPGTPYELAHTYTIAEVEQLTFTQDSGSIYIAHPDHPPRVLTRDTDILWTLTDLDLIGPFQAFYDHGGGNGTISTTSSPVTVGSPITLVANGDISGVSFFTTANIGQQIMLGDGSGGDPGVMIVDTLVNQNQVSGTVLKAFGDLSAAEFKFGAWSPDRGFPGVVEFHQQRSVWAGQAISPTLLQFSQTALPGSFIPFNNDGDIADDNSFDYEIESGKQNTVVWLKSTKTLMIGTIGAEFQMTGNDNGVLTPDSPSATQESVHGSAAVDPTFVANEVIFLQRAKRKLRALAFDFVKDGYEADDITVFGEHLTQTGLVDLAYQQEPNSIIWAVRTDGLLIAFTYDKKQAVVGGSRHPVGGTDALVKHAAVIPSSSTLQDEVWIVVSRTINSATYISVEYGEKEFDHDTPQTDGYFVDCGITYNSVPTSTITGLSHLEGEVVSILADGAAHPDRTVASGQITLQSNSSIVHVGLAYRSLLRSLKIGQADASGSTIGRKQRIHTVTLDVLRSMGMKLARPDDATEYPYNARNFSDALGVAPVLRSGIYDSPFASQWSRSARFDVIQDLPLPLTIVSATPRLDVNES